MGSIISIILAFVFPFTRYESSPSGFYPFWIWGFPYFPIFEINILDIPQKIISLNFLIITFFLISSIFSLRKNPTRLDFILNKWLGWGIGILILNTFWIISWIIIVPFFAPYGFIFEFVVVLPFVGGLLLILGKIYFMRIYSKRNENQNYTDLKWLEKQHFELNKNIQQIADEQHVSMKTIKKWIDKIEETK